MTGNIPEDQRTLSLSSAKVESPRRVRVKRMKAIWARYLHYVETYMDGDDNTEVMDKTYILDMVYGIGISIDKDAYWGANGFDRFKAELREHIK